MLYDNIETIVAKDKFLQQLPSQDQLPRLASAKMFPGAIRSDSDFLDKPAFLGSPLCTSVKSCQRPYRKNTRSGELSGFWKNTFDVRWGYDTMRSAQIGENWTPFLLYRSGKWGKQQNTVLVLRTAWSTRFACISDFLGRFCYIEFCYCCVGVGRKKIWECWTASGPDILGAKVTEVAFFLLSGHWKTSCFMTKCNLCMAWKKVFGKRKKT